MNYKKNPCTLYIEGTYKEVYYLTSTLRVFLLKCGYIEKKKKPSKYFIKF